MRTIYALENGFKLCRGSKIESKGEIKQVGDSFALGTNDGEFFGVNNTNFVCSLFINSISVCFPVAVQASFTCL